MRTCDRLDDYLCRLLSAEQEKEFEEHAAACEACASAMREQAGLFVELRDAVGSEPLPVGLTIGVAMPHARPAKPRAATAVVVSLAAVVLSLFSLVDTATVPESARRTAATGGGTTPRPAHQSPSIRVSRTAMAVPVESGDPDVTILMIYSPRASSTDGTHTPEPPRHLATL